MNLNKKMARGIQYVTDETGVRTGVLIDLRRHKDLWEDFYDGLVSHLRRNEPRIPWSTVRESSFPRKRRHG
jgi:hypothetical protein